MKPSIICVITAHKKFASLQKLARSFDVLDTVLPDRVIVAENGSKVSEEIGRYFRPDMTVEYIHVAEGNKSNALNQVLTGIEDGTLVVMMDDDIVVTSPVYFQRYAEAAQKYTDSYFGGEFTVEYEAEPRPELIKYMPKSNQGVKFGELLTPEVPRFFGCNWAVFAGDLRKAGGFSMNYGPGAVSGARGQESQMQIRLMSEGLQPIRVPDASVEHFVPRAYVQEEWIIDRKERSSMYRGAEEGSPLKLIYWKIMIFLLGLPVVGGVIHNKIRKATYRGYVKGYRAGGR